MFLSMEHFKMFKPDRKAFKKKKKTYHGRKKTKNTENTPILYSVWRWEI